MARPLSAQVQSSGEPNEVKMVEYLDVGHHLTHFMEAGAEAGPYEGVAHLNALGGRPAGGRVRRGGRRTWTGRAGPTAGSVRRPMVRAPGQRLVLTLLLLLLFLDFLPPCEVPDVLAGLVKEPPLTQCFFSVPP